MRRVLPPRPCGVGCWRRRRYGGRAAAKFGEARHSAVPTPTGRAHATRPRVAAWQTQLQSGSVRCLRVIDLVRPGCGRVGPCRGRAGRERGRGRRGHCWCLPRPIWASTVVVGDSIACSSAWPTRTRPCSATGPADVVWAQLAGWRTYGRPGRSSSTCSPPRVCCVKLGPGPAAQALPASVAASPGSVTRAFPGRTVVVEPALQLARARTVLLPGGHVLGEGGWRGLARTSCFASGRGAVRRPDPAVVQAGLVRSRLAERLKAQQVRAGIACWSLAGRGTTFRHSLRGAAGARRGREDVEGLGA